METTPLIEVKDVRKIYHVGEMDVNALNGVSFTVAPGEICCIIGRSGSGKSTLLNVMAGLEKVTDGQIVIGGEHLERMNQADMIVFRQKHVGFVFQSFNLMPYYTAEENVAFPLCFRGVSGKERSRRAREALETVGLSSHLKHKPAQMSGGQQQRVGIARALVTDPELVFADEPTGNLDSNTSDAVMKMITSTLRREGKTLIMVTHDPNMAAFADTVIRLLDGKITELSRNPHPVNDDQYVFLDDVKKKPVAGDKKDAGESGAPDDSADRTAG